MSAAGDGISHQVYPAIACTEVKGLSFSLLHWQSSLAKFVPRVRSRSPFAGFVCRAQYKYLCEKTMPDTLDQSNLRESPCPILSTCKLWRGAAGIMLAKVHQQQKIGTTTTTTTTNQLNGDINRRSILCHTHQYNASQ